MPSRRGDIRLTSSEQGAFLETQPFGVLGTTGTSGHPHLVTLGFALDGRDTIVATSFRSAQKVANVRRSPRGSFLVERSTPYDAICGVLLSGPIEILDDRASVATWYHRIKERTSRLVDLSGFPAVDDDVLITKRVALVLRAERTVSWDHRKLGGVY